MARDRRDLVRRQPKVGETPAHRLAQPVRLAALRQAGCSPGVGELQIVFPLVKWRAAPLGGLAPTRGQAARPFSGVQRLWGP
jgi:hypothetical protein